MIYVPESMRPHIKFDYPIGNKLIFEEWFYRRYSEGDNKTDREYLPIFPTSFTVNANYGKDRKRMNEMQLMFDGLDRNKKYFTIVQFDDGIKFDLKGLDIKIFGMGGGRIDFPLPLLCQPQEMCLDCTKDLFASFVGANTHAIRGKLISLLDGKPNYKVSVKKVHQHDYLKLMSRTQYALCPRGYGESSFRIAEALQYQAVPVYISDNFIIPFNEDFNEYGITIHAEQVDNIDSILSGISVQDYGKKKEAGQEAYNKMFTYEGAYQMLIKNI